MIRKREISFEKQLKDKTIFHDIFWRKYFNIERLLKLFWKDFHIKFKYKNNNEELEAWYNGQRKCG